MTRWKRRLITDIVLVLLMAGIYKKMVDLGWLQHTILMYFGVFGIAAGLLGFVTKPNESFARFLGHDSSRNVLFVEFTLWILAGVALLVWAMYLPQNSK